MKKILSQIITVLIMVIIVVVGVKSCQQPVIKEDAKVANEKCYEACKEDLLICIAYVENFKSKPYFCGAKWTIGYGTTIFPKGTRVTKNAKPISKAYAKECVYAHCDKRIKPYILKYVTRPLTKEEMLGCCMFIYNVGGENFAGYKGNGKKAGKPSAFLTALNNDDNRLKTCEKMTGFRASGGRRANGLLKRHWVQAAIFMGIITPEDLLGFRPADFYKDNLSFYYKKVGANKQGYWEYDFSEEKIQKFVKQNSHQTQNVKAIL